MIQLTISVKEILISLAIVLVLYILFVFWAKQADRNMKRSKLPKAGYPKYVDRMLNIDMEESDENSYS